MRIYAQRIADSIKNNWNVPNILLQKFPSETFKILTKINFHPNNENEKIGLIIMGTDYASISLVKKQDGIYLQYAICKEADKGKPEQQIFESKINSEEIYFSVQVKAGAYCSFSYSTDNKNYSNIETPFIAKPGRWIGAKFGYFCSAINKTNDAGSADIDWCRILPIDEP